MVNTHSCPLLADDTTRPAVLSRGGSLCCQPPALEAGTGDTEHSCAVPPAGARGSADLCADRRGTRAELGCPRRGEAERLPGTHPPGRGQHSAWVGPRSTTWWGVLPQGPWPHTAAAAPVISCRTCHLWPCQGSHVWKRSSQRHEDMAPPGTGTGQSPVNQEGRPGLSLSSPLPRSKSELT